MNNLEWEKGFGIRYKNAAGGYTPIVTNENKINTELLDNFKYTTVEYKDISGTSLYSYFLTLDPGYYKITEDSLSGDILDSSGKKIASGSFSGDPGMYLIFKDKTVLKLGNDFLTE